MYITVLCFTEPNKVSLWKQPLLSPASLQSCLYFPFWSFFLWMCFKTYPALVEDSHYLYVVATQRFNSLIVSSLGPYQMNSSPFSHKHNSKLYINMKLNISLPYLSTVVYCLTVSTQWLHISPVLFYDMTAT